MDDRAVSDQALKRFIDACHQARRITELLPELPAGMTPRHVHVLDVIERMDGAGRASDVADELRIARPGVTNLVNDLARHGLVEKTHDPIDKRVMRLSLSPRGLRFHDFYVRGFYAWLASEMDGLDDASLLQAAETIRRMGDVIRTARTALPHPPDGLWEPEADDENAPAHLGPHGDA